MTMTVAQILTQIEGTQGTNAKIEILRTHKNNEILKKALSYGLDGFKQFNVVKVPKVKDRGWFKSTEIDTDSAGWDLFFEAADKCAAREVTGNAAVSEMLVAFECNSPEAEAWQRKILQKRFAIGANTSTINKVFPGLIRTFEVQLAAKYDPDTAQRDLPSKIFCQPKLDGVRMLAVVPGDGTCQMLTRQGKELTNFEATIGKELASLPTGVYDGEIMGSDFQSLMRQVRRKENVDVSNSYVAIFDFLPITEWHNQEGTTPFFERRKMLCNLQAQIDSSKFLRLVNQEEIDNNPESVQKWHDVWFAQGYEGLMIRHPLLPYRFGRGKEVLKCKLFEDADLKCIGFKEGTGKHVGTLGSILVDFNGVEVCVGSGFTDDERHEVWQHQDSYLGATAEVRYQNLTDDLSLRFPTFVGWRTDKEV